ncbi:hypothetical protein EDC01DRAFT_233980 [Geopyxis carbonaria]|nr:hypothetical protein EDC01DRAFT_233980 [Geopyxis carbonaria]
MTSTMDRYFNSPQPYRKPSAESSPPPSPDFPPNTSHNDQSMARPLPLPTLATTPSLGLAVPRSTSTTRPRLHSREVTPPSPPNSLLLNEGGSPATTTATEEIMATPPSRITQTVEHTPPNSFKDKFTRVFRGRGFSDASIGSFRKHRKGNSDSTNTTTNPLGLTQTTSSRSSVHMELDGQRKTKGFYAEQPGPPPARSRQNSLSQFGGQPRRTIMNGGEVRVQILPQNIPNITPETKEPLKTNMRDSSSKYYNYYTTRSNSPDSVMDDDSTGILEDQNAMVQPPLKSDTEENTRGKLTRSKTYATQSSSESQERKFAEQVVSTLGFEGFHFALSDEGSEEASSPRENSGTFQDRDGAQSPKSGVYMSSGKPSSTVLVRNESNTERSFSSLAQNVSSRSNSQLGRPDLARNKSPVNFTATSVQGSNGTSPDDVARELRRLSKISAGSGVSGMAIVITADGAASMHVAAEESEDEYSLTERKWTREEKGKDRATSSVPSGVHDQHSRSSRKESRQDHRFNEGRSSSRASDSSIERPTSHGSEAGEEDSKSLLPGGGEAVQRKLKAQQPSKDVLVHQADPNFEFIYRMRRTSNDNPVLVPQYRFQATSAFPNRNALGPPLLANPPKTADGTTFSSMSFANRPSGSILRKPPSAAILRSPVVDSYVSIPQGDQTYDRRPRTSHGGESISSSDSMVHPAFRITSASSDSSRARKVASMSSLEMFGNGLRLGSAGEPSGQIPTGSPSIARTSFARTEYSEIEEIPGRSIQIDRLQPPERSHRSSWDPSRYLGHLTSSRRPSKFLRRSLTPHLYSPQEIGLESMSNKSDGGSSHGLSPPELDRQKNIGRCLILLCLAFPPLLFVFACGGFDSFIASWTNGQVKRVASTEKKIALILGTFLLVAAVAGIIAGVSLAATR